MLAPFKLVTFDVTGTLLKPKSVCNTYADFAKRHGIPADFSSLELTFRKAYKKYDVDHPNFGLESGLGWRNWWKFVVKETFKLAAPVNSPPINSSAINDVADELIDHYSQGTAINI